MRTGNIIPNISRQLPPANEKLLSVKEAAAQLGVSTSWLSSASVPKVKLGRRTLYRPSDLAAYVNARVSHRAGLEDV